MHSRIQIEDGTQLSIDLSARSWVLVWAMLKIRPNAAPRLKGAFFAYLPSPRAVLRFFTSLCLDSSGCTPGSR